MADQPPFDYTGRCVLHGRLDCPPCEAAEELVDDLANVLSHMVVGWESHLGVDLAQHPDVLRVMARYRAAKAMGT